MNISPKGAPKPYPNLYLSEDLFKDTMKTSGYENIHVFFDPEYINAGNSVDGLFESAGLISTDQKDELSTYHIQILNLDMQQNRTVDIKINDKEGMVTQEV